MTTTAKKQQQSDIAEQVAEFEAAMTKKLGKEWKVKTEDIQPRGKDGKPMSKAEKNMKKSSKGWGKKQQKLFGVKKGSKAL